MNGRQHGAVHYLASLSLYYYSLGPFYHTYAATPPLNHLLFLTLLFYSPHSLFNVFLSLSLSLSLARSLFLYCALFLMLCREFIFVSLSLSSSLSYRSFHPCSDGFSRSDILLVSKIRFTLH